MASGKYLFTSESVSMGHPDKLADQISDGVLDALLAQDPMSRVACETMVTTGIAIVAGEITSKGVIDYPTVVREVIRAVGYTDDHMGICADTCAVMTCVDKQSPDIAMGVNENQSAGKEIGAGDQGLMFGYACNDTPELMPLPIALAHRILNRLTEARQKNEVNWLRPDSKSQVTIEYDGPRAVRVDTVVVSTQHSPDVKNDEIKRYVIDKIVKPCLPDDLDTSKITYHINPTGRFVVGGPHGDCGLTGRKIIVDTYGGWGRHGGGAFSGKDPTKVDRSAAYMARHVAKNIVAAGLADRCEVQLAYAIGVTDPVSVHVDTEGTGRIDDERICALIREFFPLTPGGIIKYLDLRRPIYRKTAAGGHFGRSEPEFTWESTKAAVGLEKQPVQRPAQFSSGAIGWLPQLSGRPTEALVRSRGMDARIVPSFAPAWRDRALARVVARWVVIGDLAILWLTAVTLVARRLVGALVEPLPLLLLVALGCTLAGLALLSRLAARQVLPARGVHWLATPAVILSAAAISLPGSSLVGLLALWGIVLGEEVGSWRLMFRGVDAPSPEPRPTPMGDDIRIDPPQIPMPHFPAEDVSQQMTRSRANDGGEVVTGWLRVALEPGQRTAAAHVAFCPPFAETPRLTVRQTSGPSARIKEGQVLPYGIRLEIKLTEAHSAGASVLVEFTAHAAAARLPKLSIARG